MSLFEPDAYEVCRKCGGDGSYWDEKTGITRICSCQEESVRDVPHARSSDFGTSHASAAKIEEAEGTTSRVAPNTMKHLVLAALRSGPLTAREIGVVWSRPTLWKRVSDCKNARLIEPHATRWDSVTQRDVIAWKLTDRGDDVLRKLDAGQVVQLS